MYFYKSLLTGFVCLLLCLQLGAQDLQQKVNLSLKGASLQVALEELHKRYGVQFSYINNDLPAAPTINLQLRNVTLQEALNRLLAPANLGYTTHKGRVIISKSLPKKAPEAPAPLPQQQAAPVEKKREPSAQTTDTEPREAPEPEVLPQIAPVREGIIERAQDEPAMQYKPPSPNLYATLDRAVFSKIASAPVESTKPYHIGLIYPLSNHGTAAGKYVNRLSLHLLVGYAAGLEGLEASAIGNIEHDYVQGAQFAGVFNVVKGDARGLQASGFVNLVGGKVRGIQFAGFSNFSRHDVQGGQFGGFGNLAAHIHGAQFAGFGNISGGVEGAQFGGFGNIASKVQGAQFAGFGNLVDSLDGVGQFAGFGNIANSVKGVQAAGFGNLTQKVEGVQMAGFLNVAGSVKGVQLGILNIADTVDGVPIGLLSLVRKGYRSAELWTGEDFRANMAFKIGVERFYNIFAIGSQLGGADRWGLGYGFGSLWRLSNRLRLNTDVMSINVFEERISESWRQGQELNLLNKFRLLGGWQFARYFSLFAGPTFNVLVSRYQNEDGTLGSRLVEKTFYDKTSTGGTNVKMWVGFNAGVRF